MVRYLFYTIGDLTYQSPLVGYIFCIGCKLFSTIVNYLTDIKRNVAIR